MSEAWGLVLIRAPQEVLDTLTKGQDQEISWDAMEKLFLGSGIKSLRDSHRHLRSHVGQGFPHEGLKSDKGYIEITTFGDEWMYAMKPLVTSGKGLEVYGIIRHEYGSTEYYALDAGGKSFFECVDLEGDDEANEEETHDQWIKFVPPELRKRFDSQSD